jgi:dynein heavy chain
MLSALSPHTSLTRAALSRAQVLNVAHLANFQGFDDHFSAHASHYQALFESQDAHAFPLAAPFDASLSGFQKLCVLRCIRPDKVMLGVQVFVAAELGNRFIEPPPFDLAECYKVRNRLSRLIVPLPPPSRVSFRAVAEVERREPCSFSHGD